ncbi:MAG: glycosyltransferase [Pseudomonadota bacterium]
MSPPSAPCVSVLLPVYDAAPTLSQALSSLWAQTFTRFEVVAVDDGSEDGCGDLLRREAGRDSRLRPLFGPHAGLVPALNRGLQACRGRYVARMDADDLAHPERLARQVELLEATPAVSVASCLVESFPRHQVGEGFRIYEAWLNSLVSHTDICREIFIESPIPHPTAVMRRLELLQLGGYRDVGWPEDYDLWLRYRAAGKVFAKVPQVLLWWREHGGRLTHTDRRYSVENFLRAKAHFLAAGPLRHREVFVTPSTPTAPERPALLRPLPIATAGGAVVSGGLLIAALASRHALLAESARCAVDRACDDDSAAALGHLDTLEQRTRGLGYATQVSAGLTAGLGVAAGISFAF